MIRPAQSKDLDQIIDLHQQAFSPYLIGQLSKSFTRYFYSKILHDSRATVLIIEKEGNVAGMVAGTIDRRGFYSAGFYVQILTAIVLNLFHGPMWQALFLSFRSKFSLKSPHVSSELLTIAVKDEYRRLGLGSRLVESFDQWMKERSVKKYMVTTKEGLSKGPQLYEHLGFELFSQKEISHLQFKIYLRTLTV